MQAKQIDGAARPQHGVQADDRLFMAAVAALRLPPNQRAAHLRARMRSELTWHLLERFASWVLEEAIADLLRDTAKTVSAAQVGDAGRGHLANDTQALAAPAGATSQNPQGAQPGGRGAAQSALETLSPASRPSSSSAEAAARREAQIAAIKRVAIRHSRLDEMRCNGIPLGDLTAGEARTWARETGRNVRFVEIVTQGLQPNMVIRKAVTPDEADEYWARAGEVQ